jgi:hypothetical protein
MPILRSTNRLIQFEDRMSVFGVVLCGLKAILVMAIDRAVLEIF